MTKADAIAERLAADWHARAPYATLTGDLAPADFAEAYAAQAALQRLLQPARGPIIGRKIALSSKAMQQMIGVGHPVGGAIFADDVHRSPATIPADSFIRMGLEAELAVVLAHDIAPGQAPADPRAVIAAVHPAFEMIEDRGADYGSLDILTLVADNAWCGGIVLGEAIPDWQDLDLADLPAELTQPGHAPEHANTGAADPMGSLAWVLDHAAAMGDTLRKGEIVITGSVVRTRFPQAGERFHYTINAAASTQLHVT